METMMKYAQKAVKALSNQTLRAAVYKTIEDMEKNSIEVHDLWNKEIDKLHAEAYNSTDSARTIVAITNYQVNFMKMFGAFVEADTDALKDNIVPALNETIGEQFEQLLDMAKEMIPSAVEQLVETTKKNMSNASIADVCRMTKALNDPHSNFSMEKMET